MRNPTGYLTITPHDGGQVKEADTFTCAHCQKVVVVPVKASPDDLGGLCRQCMGMICPHCLNIGTCTPWEKQMEKQEARYEALRSYGLA